MASGNYLIDSDVLIDHLRGYAPARDFLSALLLDGATLYFFSVISEAEIYSNVRPGEEPRIHALFDAMSRLIVDGAVARRAGSYRDALRATTRLALPDALIAATAREHDATLVTRNVRHYTTPQDGQFRAYAPTLAGCEARGVTPEEARERLLKALYTRLMEMLAGGETPPSDEGAEIVNVVLPAPSQ